MASKCKVCAKANVTGKRASDIPICSKCFVFMPNKYQKELVQAWRTSFTWEERVEFEKILAVAALATFDVRAVQMPTEVKGKVILRDKNATPIDENDKVYLDGNHQICKVLRVNAKEGKVLVQTLNGHDYVLPERIQIMQKWEGEHDE